MKEYTFGKKAAGAVLHQLSMVLAVTCLFAMDYFIKNDMMQFVRMYTIAAISFLVSAFVALAFLTSACGVRDQAGTEIKIHWIDQIYGDLLAIFFISITMGLVAVMHKITLINFSLAGLMVSTGCVTYLADAVFLVFYLSVVRRAKADMLWKQTLIYQVVRLLSGWNKTRELPAVTRKSRERRELQEVLEQIAEGSMDVLLDVDRFHGRERDMAICINSIGIGLSHAVEESIRNEKMKADLITNVSHDIKTPLTSIVNYVDLLKRENLENERAREYIRILDEKSQRLKQLTEDLVEASKISSGNIKLEMQNIDFVELLYQTGGEFNERFEARDLTIVTKIPNEQVLIYADGRQLYRAIENLYTNAAKYALEKTRVYVELSVEEGNAVFTMKNVSKNPLGVGGNKDGDELTERFVRGEESRTTEGSGLGLSIAKNLTTLMGGKFKIIVDGDLFLATISFKMACLDDKQKL